MVRLDRDLKVKLNQLRLEKGISTNFIANKAIREWLEKNRSIDLS